jgi:hypothetical protein
MEQKEKASSVSTEGRGGSAKRPWEGLLVPSDVVDALPIETTGKALAPNMTTGGLEAILLPQVETLHWGFSIQYSTYYLTSRFTGGPPKKEPLN